MVAGHAHRRRDGLAVGLDGGRVVADVTAEVEAGIRPGAPPRRPVGEAEVDGAPDPVRSMEERQWNTTTNLSTASGPASHRCAGAAAYLRKSGTSRSSPSSKVTCRGGCWTGDRLA